MIRDDAAVQVDAVVRDDAAVQADAVVRDDAAVQADAAVRDYAAVRADPVTLAIQWPGSDLVPMIQTNGPNKRLSLAGNLMIT